MAALTAPQVVLPPEPGVPDDLRPLPGSAVHRRTGEGIGTQWRLAMALDDPARAADGERAIKRALAMVVAQMSQWQPDSQLSRFNAAPAGTAFTLAPGFAHVLDCALTLAQMSDGAFDPALGRASEAWGFGVGPSPACAPELSSHARRVDWRALRFDPATRHLVQPGRVQLDLSGIAKGFAVDLASHLLRQAGIQHHLVEIGGELRGAGVRPDGQPWWVAVESPPGQTSAPVRIALTGWSIATSGDWQRRRGSVGQSWSHTLSPMTGAPVANGLRAASVLHRGCMQADALATVMMVLDSARGMALAERHGIPVRMICSDGTIKCSAAWRAML